MTKSNKIRITFIIVLSLWTLIISIFISMYIVAFNQNSNNYSLIYIKDNLYYNTLDNTVYIKYGNEYVITNSYYNINNKEVIERGE